MLRTRHLKLFGIAALAVILSGCGPTPQEIGAAVLIAAPASVLALAFVSGLFQLLLQRELPRDVRQLAPLLGALGVSVAASLFGLKDVPSDKDLIGLAVFVCSSAELVWGQLLWLLMHARAPRRPFGLFILPVVLVTQIIPAFLLLEQKRLGIELTEQNDGGAIVGILWLLPSSMGIAPGVLFLLILIGIFVHRRRRAALAEQVEIEEVAEVFS